MKKPYITIKFAETLDGKIAATDGSSKWISSSAARKFSHKLRRENDAIMVGAKTITKDNPSLTTRFVRGKNPIRIVIDGKLRIAPTSNIIKSAKKIKTIIVTTPKNSKRKIAALEKEGVEFIFLKASKSGVIDLKVVIRILYKKGVQKLLVEGGAALIALFLKNNLADKIIVIVSPKILGRGTESVGELGIKSIKCALKLRFKSVKAIGDDIIYTAFL